MKTPRERRDIILSEMGALDERGVNCATCSGVCCTSYANSMQTTPLETRDALTHLQEQGLWTEELREKLRSTVTKFRLDQIPGNGRRSFLRRTYDCPFFAGRSLGCTIPPEIKPYGCLGFNPALPGTKEGEGCHSDQGLLSRQAAVLAPIDHHLASDWDKLPFPLALLRLAEELTNDGR